MQGKSFRFLDPKSDIVFKKIFGQHPALIKSFLNNVLPLPEGHLIESVEYITPEQAPRIPAMKNTIVDVKCLDETGRIFIVEMQMTWTPTFVKRFLFGTSRAYVQQLDAGESYDTLCPVYGLALVNRVFDEETEDCFHHYRMTNVKDMDKALEGIELVFVELPKFNPQTWAHRKLGALWLRFLREMGTLREIPPEFQESPELLKAVTLAEEASYTKGELDAYDYYLDALRVEKAIRHDAYAEGREEGHREAMEKFASQLIGEGFGAEKISQLTGLSVEEVQTLFPQT